MRRSKQRGESTSFFANARTGGFLPLVSVTEEFYDNIFNTNVKGTLFMVQKALPLLNDGASIILNGSVASVIWP
jgi:NAD(P)-dependent dehydrogenase (short-subunit alcohol dehydrogenase family)